MPWRAALALLALLAAHLSPALAQTADYQLGSMDKLRIRVVEWQTAEGAIRDWSSLSGDYVIGPSGSISVPFIGEMPAVGKTTAEIAAAIGDELQQKLGLPNRPDASVELAEFRPVFVSGDVETPGKYPYDPQLTVLKAVSLAGGLRHSAAGGDRDFINAQGSYAVLIAQRDGLVARRARLIAEADGKQDIDFPAELRKTPEGRRLIEDETAFMAARAKRLRLQLAAIDDLKQLLQSEIATLDKKIATQNRQVELSRTELQGLGNLKEQGLVVNARVLSIEQTIAELEGKVLDMQTASLRAKQDIAKATQDATTLQNDRDTQIAQDRQEAEAAIEEVTLKMATNTSLMTEALTRGPGAATSAVGPNAPAIGYAIVRTTDGKATETAADENTPVLPGDVVKVAATVVPAD
jgi:exopolysaccharide production protein ExoF